MGSSVLSGVVSVITVGIDPTVELGPVTLAWHGITIALGIVVAWALAARVAQARGLSTEPLYAIAAWAALAGLVGGKLLYLLETGRIADAAAWLSTRGFTFNGGLVLAAIVIATFLWRTRTSPTYLDVVAIAFPLGVAVGRIGDVINGEHYGPPSDWLLAVRNTHPDAEVPSPVIAYHSGGLYDVLLGLGIFAVVWPLRHRLSRPFTAVWLVLGLFAVGRFFAFFYRSDSEDAALALTTTQWSCVVLFALAVAGYWWTRRKYGRRPSHLELVHDGRRRFARRTGD